MGTALGMADDAAWSALFPVDLDQVGAARGGRGALELAGGDDGAVIGQEVRAVVDEVLGAAQMAGVAGRIGDEHGVHAPDEVQGLDGHGVGGQGVDVLGRTAAGDLTGRRAAEAVGDDGLGMGLFSQQAGGVAVINAGAASETELKEKKLRLEDALNATKAAVEEGIVAGGGVSLIRAIKAVQKYADKQEGDMKTGARIVERALEEPVRQIATNAGFDGSVVVAAVKDAKGDIGFNAANEQYEDMIKAGIVDPVKVTRSALQNAGSVASMLLTTEAGITQIKEPEPAMPAGGAPGMGMM